MGGGWGKIVWVSFVTFVCLALANRINHLQTLFCVLVKEKVGLCDSGFEDMREGHTIDHCPQQSVAEAHRKCWSIQLFDQFFVFNSTDIQ